MMAGKKQLPPVRLVTDDDVVDRAPVAPERASHLANLRAMQGVLEAHIHNENTLARDLSPLVRQARDISREISELEEAEQVAREEAGSDTVSDDESWSQGAI